MDKLKLILIGLVGLVLIYAIMRALIETSFERLDRDFIEITDYAVDESEDGKRVKQYREGKFRVESVYPTDNRRLVHHLDDKYWVFWTGVVDLDDGLRFIYTPRHSRLIIVERSSEQILSNDLFLRFVTNARIQDGYVYFVYVSWGSYKLGRYKLND